MSSVTFLTLLPLTRTLKNKHGLFRSCQVAIKGLRGRFRVGGHSDFQVHLICCVHTSMLAGGPTCGQVI